MIRLFCGPENWRPDVPRFPRRDDAACPHEVWVPATVRRPDGTTVPAARCAACGLRGGTERLTRGTPPT